MLPPCPAESCSAEGIPAAWLPARKAAARLPHSKACGAEFGSHGIPAAWLPARKAAVPPRRDRTPRPAALLECGSHAPALMR
jgi:hypothetical protein